ncbi:MAG: hypothetical protein ABW081_11435 [Solirubrobacteraceae bacterium]
MRIHRCALPLGAILLSLGLAAPAAEGAKPSLERIVVDDEFFDEELSEACGFDITGHAVGKVTLREFSGGRLAAVNNVNVVVTFSANGNTFALHDVGADVARVLKDGTIQLAIIGQVPFGFTGVLKIDPETEEVSHEPQHDTEASDLEAACAALA